MASSRRLCADRARRLRRVRGQLRQPGGDKVGHLFPALLRDQQVRTAGELVKIGARRRVFVVLVVRPADVRGDQVVLFAGDQQQRGAIIILEVDMQRVVRIQRGKSSLEEQ